ncbi:MAG: single-stranded DNA-binding protein [Propionibacteriaceae bacterium]|nr:single-stranded DNA-binding protein [Propionibacteriaceae bacterium]
MDITVTLTGNLGADPETRLSAAGLPVTSFRVATTPRLNRHGVWIDGATTWTQVTCFRDLATHVGRSLRKGQPVIVHGRLRTSEWIGSDGAKHDRAVVEAIAVGHDLNRGASQFTRSERSAEIVSAPPDEVDEADPAEAEAPAALAA